MPFNFSKQQETVSPSVTVNTYMQDESLPAALGAVTDAAEAMLEGYQNKKATEAVAGFNDLMGEFAEDRALFESEQAAALNKAEQEFTLKMRGVQQGSPEEAAVRQNFMDTVSAIRDAEIQTGADYNYRIAAEVRRYSSKYPTMTAEFQKVLSFNQQLDSYRKSSMQAASESAKAQYAARAAAVASGRTLDEVFRYEDILREQQELAAQIQSQVLRGAMSESSWKPFILADTMATMEMALLDVEPILRAAAVGQINVGTAKLKIEDMKQQALAKLYANQQMIHQASEQGATFSPDGKPIRIDISEQEKMITQTFANLLASVNSGDYLNWVSAREKTLKNAAWAQLGTLYFPNSNSPLNGSLAEIFGAGSAVRAMESMQNGLSLGYSVSAQELAAAAKGGGSEATRKLFEGLRFRLWRENVVAGRQWPPREWIPGTEENYGVLVSYLNAIYRGDPVPPEQAVIVQPMLVQMFNHMGIDPTGENGPTAGQVARAATDVAALEFKPGIVQKVWSKDNILNPKSDVYSIPAIKQAPDEVAAALEGHQMEAEAAIRNKISDREKAAIRRDPNGENGWSFTPYTYEMKMGRGETTTATQSQSDMVQWLQRLYFFTKQTLGQSYADQVADQIWNNSFPQSQEPEVTNNQTEVVMEWTAEDEAKYGGR